MTKHSFLYVLLFIVCFTACHLDQRGQSRTIQESKQRGVFIKELEANWVLDVDTLIPTTNEFVFFLEEQFCYGWDYQKAKKCKRYFPENNGIQLIYGTNNPCDSFKSWGSKCDSQESKNNCRPIPSELLGKVSDLTERVNAECQNFFLEKVNKNHFFDIKNVFDTTFLYVIESYDFDSIGYVEVYIPPKDEVFRLIDE